MKKSKTNDWGYLHEHWYWVALVVCGYQIGLTLFHVLNLLNDGYNYASQPGIVLFVGAILVSIAFYIQIYLHKSMPSGKKWMLTAATAFLGTAVGSFALGDSGTQAFTYSIIGIAVSFEVIFGSFFEQNRFIEEYNSIIMSGLAGLLWLLLIVRAPRMNTNVLRVLQWTMISIISVSILGCASLKAAPSPSR
jgi:hypothetical protein